MSLIYSRLNVTIKGVRGPQGQSLGNCFARIRVGHRQRRTQSYPANSGDWQENFLYDLTYHEHLFWNLQVDVYQSRLLLPKLHLGRVEVRLSKIQFTGLSPEIHWHELDDPYGENVNFRLLGLRTAREELDDEAGKSEAQTEEEKARRVRGQVQLQISYERLCSAKEISETPIAEQRVIQDTEMRAFNELRGEDSEGDELASENNSEALNEIISESASATLSSREDLLTATESKQLRRTETLESELRQDQRTSWIVRLSSYVLNEKDFQVFRDLRFMVSGFGMGVEASNWSLAMSFFLLQKFYDLQPQIFTNNLVLTKEEMDLPRHLYKMTFGTLGWAGLNYYGKAGKGYLTDYLRSQANYKCLLEFLKIPESDLLVFNLDDHQLFRPNFFVSIDRNISAIVLVIRGTMSVRDAMTDLVCEYVPWKDGLTHSGVLKASNWFFENIGKQLVMFAEEYGMENIFIVGHSLGGATAALTAIHLYDELTSRAEGWPSLLVKGEKKRVNLHCYTYGPPPVVSESIAEKYKFLIDTFVNGDDIVPRLSFGSVLDLHTFLAYAASIANASHLFQSLESTPIIERLKHCRQTILQNSVQLNPKLAVPGRLHHIVSLDAPNSTEYRVVETVDSRRFQEVAVRRKMLVHHMPDRYERAIDEAYATFLSSLPEERGQLAHDAMTKSESGDVVGDDIVSEGSSQSSSSNASEVEEEIEEALKNGKQLPRYSDFIYPGDK